MREPLPKEFVIEAWKASVGRSFDKNLTQDAFDMLVFNDLKCEHKEPKFQLGYV